MLAGLAVGLLGIVLATLVGDEADGDEVVYSELAQGDCFASGALTDTASVGLSRVEVISCDEPHLVEVYATVEHPGPAEEPFPGMDALVLYASLPCQQQFAAYAGVPFAQLNLLDVYVTPQQRAWEQGNRIIVCGVASPDGEPTLGSVRQR